MSSIQFRNLIFPAVLMSSAVFSALTLPLVLFEPEPVAVAVSDISEPEPQSPISQGFQPILDIFESGNKGLAIRYIGFSIVASVGAGIATAEMMRKTTRRFDLAGDRFTSSKPSEDLIPAFSEWAEAMGLDPQVQHAIERESAISTF